MSWEYFDGKNVFITGGSKGVGLAFAKIASEQGAHVWATYSTDLSEDARKAKNNGINFIKGDVRDPILARELLEDMIMKEGCIDILNTNAAISYLTPRDDSSYLDNYEICMDINVKGVMNYANPWLNYLKQSEKEGALVIPSSVIVPMTNVGHSGDERSDWFFFESLDPYAATKAAVQSYAGDLMRTFNPKFGKNQLVVVVPQYGAVDTSMLMFEAQQVASQYEKRTKDSCTPERFLKEIFPLFNSSGRNLTAKETAEFTADILETCLKDRKSRVVPQPGGPAPVDYKWD